LKKKNILVGTGLFAFSNKNQMKKKNNANRQRRVGGVGMAEAIKEIAMLFL
jgi:hypothetical protein